MLNFHRNPASSKPLKNFSLAFVPYSFKNPEGVLLRKAGFTKGDTNGSGMASLAEIENFIAFALQDSLRAKNSDDAFSLADDLFNLFRPCFRYAFNRAKDLAKNKGKINGTKNATGDDYVSFAEFRMFCIYLQVYAAMFDIFTVIDGGGKGRTKDDDSRISLKEFLSGYHSLGGLGFRALQGLNDDALAISLFNAVDVNGGGFVLYGEWVKYLTSREIKDKTKIGTLLRGNLELRRISGGISTASSVRSDSISLQSGVSSLQSGSTIFRARNSPTKKVPRVAGVYMAGNSCSNELRNFIRIIQPYTEKTSHSKQLRKLGFRKVDANGSGRCSLAEVDGFILNTLKKTYGLKIGRKIFKHFRPSYIVAYNSAKNLKRASSAGEDDDYINFQEFRMLNIFLAVYAGMLDAFSTIDGGGKGISEDDDRRVEKEEWIEGFVHLSNTGFVGLEDLSSLENALDLFDKMDHNKSGRVLFQDFCNCLLKAEIETNTDLGIMLSGGRN